MIDEKRKRRLDSLNPNYISSTGRYNDFANHDLGEILTHEEIIYLRKKYDDTSIAAGYEFANVMRFEEKNLRQNKSNTARVNPRQPRTPSDIKKREQQNAKTNAQYQPRHVATNSGPIIMQRSKKRNYKRKNYALQRVQKFVGSITKELTTKIDQQTQKVLIKVGTGVLVVAIGLTAFGVLVPDKGPITIIQNPDTTYVDSNVAGTQEELIATNPEVDIMEVRRSTVEKYAYIYQLDFNTAWYFMEWITNNFQDSGYLNEYTLENISCKGSGQLYCNSEEELISYTMRVLKQEPGRFGLTKEQLARKTNDYVRPTTMEEYKKIIFDTCKVHGVDPALIYAIVRQETGFNSDYFMNSNNPGGIYFDGKNIVKFDTLEEGILELIHEVEKYLRLEGIDLDNIDLSVEDLVIIIGNKHCPENDEKDTQGLNKYWKPNVAEFYYEAMPEFERMEIEYQANQAVESTSIKH